MEFPACKSCNNATSKDEDVARILSLLQGTVMNSEVLSDYVDRSNSYDKAMELNKLKFTETGLSAFGHPLVRISESNKNAIIMLAIKTVLGLYYNINNNYPMPSTSRIALTAMRADNMALDKLSSLNRWPSQPQQQDFKSTRVANQFYYRFCNYDDHKDQLKYEGWSLNLWFHFHLGYFFFAKVFDSVDHVKDNNANVYTCLQQRI